MLGHRHRRHAVAAASQKVDTDSSTMPPSFRFFPLLLVFLCSGRAQTITFSEHIAPIIYNNCSTCHRPGTIGPFPLLSYDDVVKKALTIGAVTQTHYMPPWKPAAGWATYRNERRLSPDQIDLIQRWVAAGAPQGDPSKAPRPPVFTDGWQLGTPDLILEMPASFAVPAEGNDVYRNFVLPTNLTEDKWVRAIELKPLARSVLHHAIFLPDTKGAGRKLESQTKDGQPGFPGFGSIFSAAANDVETALAGGLGGWVPGTTPAFLPEGLAMPLPKGSDILLQTHFHLNGIAQVEKTTLGIYFAPKPARRMTQIQVPGFFGVLANIDIPAGEKNFKLRGTFTLPVDVDAVQVASHMHYLAKESKLTATLPSGEVKILLWIREWDINWQDQYIFKDPMPLPKGTRLDGEITYDNSADNPRNPTSPPKRVTWGEQSTDEMGSLIVNVVPRQDSDYTPLQAATLVYSITRAPQVGNRPLFVSSGMVDGASTEPGAVTPGKIVVLYGSRIASETPAAAQFGGNGRLATELGGTQVLFDGVPAPLLYTSSGQLGAVVPYAVEGKSGTQVQVRTAAGLSDMVAMPVTPVGPSIFSMNYTGSGQGAILNEDGETVNSTARPAGKGSVISIFATGEGQTQPGGIDGEVASGSASTKPARAVLVRINGHPAEVLYAGGAPRQVAGLFQVNVRIPADTPSGEAPVEIQVGDAKSQPGITVAVR
jgi:uncharacterized protein (TIGR03437 family)